MGASQRRPLDGAGGQPPCCGVMQAQILERLRGRVGLTADLSASGNYPSGLCDLAEYAHPEFANPFVNLMYVGAPVAED